MTTAKNSTITPRTAPAFVGIDLAKNSVHVHGVDEAGRTCVDRKLKPAKLKAFLSNLEPCVVGMEACGRSHQWGRDVMAMGHDAKLMAPQFVKPYVKSNKSDRADAEVTVKVLPYGQVSDLLSRAILASTLGYPRGLPRCPRDATGRFSPEVR